MFMLRRFVRKPARGDSRRSCFASCRHKVLNKLANVLSERQTHNEDMEIHILALPGDHSAAVGLVLWNQGLNICVSSAVHRLFVPDYIQEFNYWCSFVEKKWICCSESVQERKSRGVWSHCHGHGHVLHLQMTSKPASEFHTLNYTSNYFLSSPGQCLDNI